MNVMTNNRDLPMVIFTSCDADATDGAASTILFHPSTLTASLRHIAIEPDEIDVHPGDTVKIRKFFQDGTFMCIAFDRC